MLFGYKKQQTLYFDSEKILMAERLQSWF